MMGGEKDGNASSSETPKDTGEWSKEDMENAEPAPMPEIEDDDSDD